jgi:hypothetical protein
MPLQSRATKFEKELQTLCTKYDASILGSIGFFKSNGEAAIVELANINGPREVAQAMITRAISTIDKVNTSLMAKNN